MRVPGPSDRERRKSGIWTCISNCGGVFVRQVVLLSTTNDGQCNARQSHCAKSTVTPTSLHTATSFPPKIVGL